MSETLSENRRDSSAGSLDRGRARKIDPADKRERILRAAREVFAEKRFEDAAVSEIVRRAGVAQGTFYRYFPSKTLLVSALAEEIQTDVVTAIEGVLGQEEQKAIPDMLEPLIRAAYRAMEQYRDVLGIIDTETLLFGASSEAQKRREPYYRLLSSLIERDQERGRVDPAMDPYVAARLMGSVMDRLARDCFVDRPGIPLERYIAETVGFLRRALGAQT